jgi:hypothetical protein
LPRRPVAESLRPAHVERRAHDVSDRRDLQAEVDYRMEERVGVARTALYLELEFPAKQCRNDFERGALTSFTGSYGPDLAASTLFNGLPFQLANVASL